MKTITITYRAEFHDEVEVPDNWEWDGSLESLCEVSDLPYTDGHLVDWGVDR